MDLNKDNTDDVKHMFWTGGWDSTFRLLQLAFLEKKIVQPHYLIRSQECTGKEIDTINNLTREINRKYPAASKRILPTEYCNSNKIQNNVSITREYDRIAKNQKINKQYEICARYCHQIDVTSMDLCVVSNEIKDYFYSNNIIFSYFEFPVSDLTKKEMAEIAIENDWMDLMKMTWFCRRPRNGRPCGLCGPCNNTVTGGIAWRLPIKSRVIAYLQLPFRKWWRNNYQRQSEGVFKKLKKNFKKRA